MLYLFRLVSFVIRRLVILRVFIVLRNVVSFVFFFSGVRSWEVYGCEWVYYKVSYVVFLDKIFYFEYDIVLLGWFCG